MEAKILAVGDEILSGATADTNSGWLAGRLTSLGIQVVEIRVIPDVEEVVAAFLEKNRDWPGLIFTMGGIGPKELTEAVVRDVDRFCSPFAPHDDCTMIALRFNGDG